MYDVIIIGGGPAGITAGIYTLRKKLKTLLITKDFIGQVGITGEIENWTGNTSITGPELMENFTQHLQKYEPEIMEEEVLGITKEDGLLHIETTNGQFSSKTVILATGRKPKRLNIDGEKEFTGKGVVYCTTCDAPFFENKKVIVVGGGNSGFEAALELTSYTNDITLLDISPTHRADEYLVQKAKDKNIETITEASIEKIKGSSFVEEVVVKDFAQNKSYSLKTDGVFVQIGSDANTKCVDSLVEKNSCGDVIVNPSDNSTATEGLFAAGDVTDVSHKQIVIAAGEGAKAGLSVYNYLKK